MAAALLFGLVLSGAAQGAGQGTGLSLSGSGAIPLRESHWIDPVEDYLARAQRYRQSGTVAARLFVDRSGRVRGCLLLERPNVPALEAATCRLLHRRARFQPFEGEGFATYDYRIVWDWSRLPIPRPDPNPLVF